MRARDLALALALALAGCRDRLAAPPPAPDAVAIAVAIAPVDAAPPVDAPACGSAQRLAAERLIPGGLVLAVDVGSGAIVAAAGDLDAARLPLSLTKLHLAAIWWERGGGDDEIDVAEMIAQSRDQPGRQLGRDLLARIGAPALRAELARLGLEVELPDDATADAWADALSIGEVGVRIVPAELARFLRGVATATLVSAPTARKLKAAMRATVSAGTARSVAARFDDTGWALGGKTGTGPRSIGPESDGWFAGIAYDGDAPRLVIAVLAPRRGKGGGVAAGIAAELALAVRTGC